MTQAVYEFIISFYREHGLPPTARQIIAGVGLHSTSAAHYQIRRLVKSKRVVMINRRPVPVVILAYLKLFNAPKY